MLNIVEALRANAAIQKLEIGDLLFAHFTCPAHDDEWVGLWAHFDHVIHVVSGRKTLRTSSGTWTIGAGETVFVKKGAYFLRADADVDWCVMMFFIPDACLRETLTEVAADLGPVSEYSHPRELVLRLNHDVSLQAFLHAMTVYFGGNQKPSELMLKLKLKELIMGLLLSASNPALAAYLRGIARGQMLSIPAIMEANYRHNLSLEAFAKLCHRSLSSFKREFRECYGMSPGKWLLKQRLDCAAHLLRTTGLSVTEIIYECGFEDPSHFCRVFKEKFGESPSAFREARVTMAF